MDKECLVIGRASDKALVPLLVGANGEVIVGLSGYFNSGWRKAPMPWGMSNIYHSFNTNLSLPAGNSQQNFPVLSANNITIVTEMAIRYSGTITNVVLALGVNDGSTSVPVMEVSPIISQRNYCWSGFLACLPTDTLYAFVQNATLNDDLYYSARGYTMQTNL